MGVEVVHLEGNPNRNVYFDGEQDHDSYWSTHYRDTYTPTKDRRRAEPKEAVTAGKKTRNFEASDEWRGMESKINAQKEIYGTTFSLDHNTPFEGPGFDRFSKTSNMYGSGSRPPTQGNQLDRRPDSAQVPRGARHPALCEEEEDRQSTMSAPNIRNAWNRNKSAVGEVVFQTKVDKKGVPVDKHSKRRSSSSSRKRREKENKRGSGRRPHDDHFLTTKDAFDNETVGTAIEHRMYGAEPMHSLGFSIKGKKKDDTTVSGDAPAWFQLPGVTVNKLNSLQLYNLLSWKAPIPKKHTADGLLEIFGVDGENSKGHTHNPDLTEHAVPSMENKRPAENKSDENPYRSLPESPRELSESYNHPQAENGYESRSRRLASTQVALRRPATPSQLEELRHSHPSHQQEQYLPRPGTQGSELSDCKSMVSLSSSGRSSRSRSSHGSRRSDNRSNKASYQGMGYPGSFTQSNLEAMSPAQLANALKQASQLSDDKYYRSRDNGSRGGGSVASGYSRASSASSYASLSTM